MSSLPTTDQGAAVDIEGAPQTFLSTRHVSALSPNRRSTPEMELLPPPVQASRFVPPEMPGHLSEPDRAKEFPLSVKRQEVQHESVNTTIVPAESNHSDTSVGVDGRPESGIAGIQNFEARNRGVPMWYDEMKKKWEQARDIRLEEPLDFAPKPQAKDHPNPWKSCLNHLVKRDKTVCEAWSEDIENILIFAGLFSAVVTSFTVESYQWMEADPADTTNAILLHISTQLAGNTTQEFVPTPFTFPASVRRINIVWFLSLVFALTTALLGILCKQWIREHRQELPARSYQEEISLRQMRFESLRYWKVRGILATLPVLLQIALGLFFIGVVDLLWTRDRTIALIISVCCLFGAVVVVTTTILPAIVFIYHTNGSPEGYRVDRADVPPCAFKSAQSWFFLKVVLVVQGFIHNITSFDFTSSALSVSNSLESWTSTDHPIIERPSNPPLRESSFARYLCSGLGWLDRHVSNKDIVPDLYHCLDHMDVAHHDASMFSGVDPPVLNWPTKLPATHIEKHNTLLQFLSRRLPHDRDGQLQKPLEQLILHSISFVEYEPETPHEWESWSIFMALDLRRHSTPSPPFLCALIRHLLRTAISSSPPAAYHLETFWICSLVQDALHYSEDTEHRDMVLRYLIDEGVLRTLRDPIQRKSRFVELWEKEPSRFSSYRFGSIRGVFSSLERLREELEIEVPAWASLLEEIEEIDAEIGRSKE